MLLGADRGAAVSMRLRAGSISETWPGSGRNLEGAPTDHREPTSEGTEHYEAAPEGTEHYEAAPRGADRYEAAPGGTDRFEGAPGGSSPVESPEARTGGSLYALLGCDGCHGPQRKMETSGLPPSLDYAGSKLQVDWIREYLRHPYRIRWVDSEVRPVTRMPDFGLRAREASEIAAYLAARQDTMRFKPFSPPPAAAEVEEGNRLIGQYSCRGCHVIGGAGMHLGPSLDGVGDRLRPGYIQAFLLDPHTIIPGTPMPDFHLWKDEARSLTAFLSGLRAPAGKVPQRPQVPRPTQ
jgi:cytochrome c2